MLNTAPPAATRVEKTAVLTLVLVVGLFLAIPVTRGIAFEAFAAVGHFLADTVINAVRSFWLVIEALFGWLA